MERHVVDQYQKIALEDFFKRPVTHVETATELFFFHEINKYLENKQMTLDFSGLIIDQELHKSNMYTFFMQRYPELRPDGLKFENFNYKLLFPIEHSVEGVSLKPIEEGIVEYDYYYDYKANEVLHRNTASTGFVSLYAYLKVQEYLTGDKMPLVRFQNNDNNTQDANNDILVLAYYGNKFVEHNIEIAYGKQIRKKNELKEELWSAYHHLCNQKGFMPTLIQMKGEEQYDALVGYSVNEKYKHLKEKYMAGDVVFLYERTKTSNNNTKASIDRCFIAVIKSYDSKNIVLERLVSSETWASQYINCDNLAERDELEGTQILSPEDYTKNIKYTTTFNLTEIGVDMLLRYETTFIMEINDFDSGSLKLYHVHEDGATRTKDVLVDSLDYVYALLEERDMDYNKARFLAKYFKGRTPVYEEYRALQVKPN